MITFTDGARRVLKVCVTISLLCNGEYFTMIPTLLYLQWLSLSVFAIHHS